MSHHAVWKFPVPLVDGFTLDMPSGAKLLAVQTQNGGAWLWALVDPAQPKEVHQFHLRGTGHPIQDPSWVYVATFQMRNGNLVFHLFEEILAC